MITARRIKAAVEKARERQRDVWLADAAPKNTPRLALRARPSGHVLAYVRTTYGARRLAIPLGAIDGGLTLAEARDRVDEIKRELRSGADPRGLLRSQVVQQQAVGTFGELMDAYIAHLAGRPSAGDVRRIVANHVGARLAATPAAQVAPEALRDELARLVDAGKLRTAAKLRSYVRAAYALAMRARFDAALGQRFGTFRIDVNPAARLPAIASVRARDVTLSREELREYWQRLQQRPAGAARDAAIAALLLGGQRIAQVVRLRARDIDLDAGIALLRDPKGGGRRALEPRPHAVPIPDALRPLIELRLRAASGADAWLFSSDGRTAVRPESVAACIAAVRDEMVTAGRVRLPFEPRDIRRTVETILAGLGVTRDTRAALLSHGLGGVQVQHYDRHAYMDEKRAALAKLIAVLQGRA